MHEITRSAKTTPREKETYTKSEKYLCALSVSPVPRALATRAEPPVPNINPTVVTIIIKGIMRFTDLNGISPAKFDTKNPSATQYIDVKIIIMTDGTVNLKSFAYEKWSPSCICIYPHEIFRRQAESNTYCTILWL